MSKKEFGFLVVTVGRRIQQRLVAHSRHQQKNRPTENIFLQFNFRRFHLQNNFHFTNRQKISSNVREREKSILIIFMTTMIAKKCSCSENNAQNTNRWKEKFTDCMLYPFMYINNFNFMCGVLRFVFYHRVKR